MARLIQKSGYIKNGKAMGYMEYVATRDGVEIIQSTEPVTKKQEQFIKRLLKDFPDAKELFEYSDYLQTPNRGTASAFIAVALDTHLHEVESESGYMSYIAQRPRAEKHGGHGLFCEVDTTDLKAAKAELDAHDGKVWTFIFSLRREDAERLGYNKAAAWQNLLKQESAAIAEAMRIRTDDFRWYAAYHDEGHHPHVHMMVWSAEPKKGYLTREGIAVMRSRMTNAIFHEEMKELYIKKDAAYKESIQTAKESLLLYIRMLENSESADPVIEHTMTGQYELIQVTKEVFQAYRRTKWNIEDSTDRFFKHETQMSSLIGGENDGYERFHEFIDYDNTPENQAIEEMVCQSLHNVLELLPPKDYELIYELYFKNHTERECAHRLGMSQQAIHERKKRILKKIKNNLDEEGC